jgi:DNA-binding CsgD family transcriptional regulator
VLERLRALVGCEWASYCELDRSRRRTLALVESPAPDADPGDAVFWRIVQEHPLCRAQASGRLDAMKLSDFHGTRELRRLDVYADWFRPLGVEYEMEVAIPAAQGQTRTFLFDDGHRDFGERERDLLNLLQPHLAQLHRAARVRRMAAGANALLEDDGDDSRQAALVVDPRGAIDAAGPRARRLLAEYLPGAGDTRLPARMARWLEQERAAARDGRPPVALTIDGPSGTLVAEFDRRGAASLIVLYERPDSGEAALSAREREVLALVRDGLRNAEIAETLWITPSTVGKHLENIFEKLGVHTRTAAVARVHGPARL